MSVYPMAVAIGGAGESASTLQVSSKSGETQFVRATVKRVQHPGTPQESEEPVVNWEGVGLVVSPPKFALPAGASRAVRIVALSSPPSEEVYRVYLERVPSPADAEPAPKETEGNVSVNLIWGVLVRMVPTKPQVVLQRTGPNTLRNGGNVRAALLEVGRCNGEADSSCQWTKLDRNIYPGADLELPGPASPGTLRIKYQLEGTPDAQVKDLAKAS